MTHNECVFLRQASTWPTIAGEVGGAGGPDGSGHPSDWQGQRAPEGHTIRGGAWHCEGHVEGATCSSNVSVLGSFAKSSRFKRFVRMIIPPSDDRSTLEIVCVQTVIFNWRMWPSRSGIWRLQQDGLSAQVVLRPQCRALPGRGLEEVEGGGRDPGSLRAEGGGGRDTS